MTEMAHCVCGSPITREGSFCRQCGRKVFMTADEAFALAVMCWRILKIVFIVCIAFSWALRRCSIAQVDVGHAIAYIGEKEGGRMNFLRLSTLGIIGSAMLFAQPPYSTPLSKFNPAPRGEKGRLSGLVDAQDKVFPRILTGEGWETVIVLVNIGTRTIPYDTYFFSADGTPMNVTFRNYPDGEIQTAKSLESRLPPNTSFNFALFDTGAPLQDGWAVITYDERLGRLGGYALLRRKDPTGAFHFEAAIPLSNNQDSAFYMPIDNIQGFRTGLSITNPSTSRTATVKVVFFDLSGNEITSDQGKLPPLTQITVSIPDAYPDLKDRLATALVFSDTSLLSAVGLRLNPETKAVATVPIINWIGMFQ